MFGSQEHPISFPEYACSRVMLWLQAYSGNEIDEHPPKERTIRKVLGGVGWGNKKRFAQGKKTKIHAKRKPKKNDFKFGKQFMHKQTVEKLCELKIHHPHHFYCVVTTGKGSCQV